MTQPEKYSHEVSLSRKPAYCYATEAVRYHEAYGGAARGAMVSTSAFLATVGVWV